MALRKWGTIRADSQLVKAGDELGRLYCDPAPNPLLETLDAGADGILQAGYRSLVHGYGDAANEYLLVDGYWPGVSGGFLTINTTTASHQFLDTSGVLTLDDAAAVADAAILSPGDVLMVIP